MRSVLFWDVTQSRLIITDVSVQPTCPIFFKYVSCDVTQRRMPVIDVSVQPIGPIFFKYVSCDVTQRRMTVIDVSVQPVSPIFLNMSPAMLPSVERQSSTFRDNLSVPSFQICLLRCYPASNGSHRRFMRTYLSHLFNMPSAMLPCVKWQSSSFRCNLSVPSFFNVSCDVTLRRMTVIVVSVQPIGPVFFEYVSCDVTQRRMTVIDVSVQPIGPVFFKYVSCDVTQRRMTVIDVSWQPVFPILKKGANDNDISHFFTSTLWIWGGWFVPKRR